MLASDYSTWSAGWTASDISYQKEGSAHSCDCGNDHVPFFLPASIFGEDVLANGAQALDEKVLVFWIAPCRVDLCESFGVPRRPKDAHPADERERERLIREQDAELQRRAEGGMARGKDM